MIRSIVQVINNRSDSSQIISSRLIRPDTGCYRRKTGAKPITNIETTLAKRASVLMNEGAASLVLLDALPTDTPVLEGLTPVSDERIVGEGAGRLAPF